MKMNFNSHANKTHFHKEGLAVIRVVTKISSCRVNTTSRLGIKRLGISFGSVFVLFSNKSSRGPLLVAGENPRPPALNDNPEL